jgi:hypothetical protein
MSGCEEHLHILTVLIYIMVAVHHPDKFCIFDAEEWEHHMLISDYSSG